MMLTSTTLILSGVLFAMSASGEKCSSFKGKNEMADLLHQESFRGVNVDGCRIYLSPSLIDLVETLNVTYFSDGVQISTYSDDDESDMQCDADKLSSFKHEVFILKPKKIDRTCLLTPKFGLLDELKSRLFLVEYEATLDLTTIANRIVERVNGNCKLFRDLGGSISLRGKRRSKMLDNLFYSYSQTHKCDRIEDISELTAGSFFRDFLFRSRPVILRNFARYWPAFKKWDLDFFLKKFGLKRVHVKLSPSSNYEGVEPRAIWQNSSESQIPDAVFSHLNYPDLVVVRPAASEITMRQLIGIIRSISAGQLTNASAYLEYTSLDSVDSSLNDDVPLPRFLDDLSVETTNLWLSDGRTIGKLHFDGADNILVQLVGIKNLTIFDPNNNENLYESHIQEAELDVEADIDENGNSRKPWKFSRNRLMDSTSMVMSPIDLDHVDTARFPNFAKATPLVCTLEPGDALFMPAFWWHEVYSQPDVKRQFNLAVNFWFKSFFVKDVPCADCRLDINSHYYDLLDLYT